MSDWAALTIATAVPVVTLGIAVLYTFFRLRDDLLYTRFIVRETERAVAHTLRDGGFRAAPGPAGTAEAVAEKREALLEQGPKTFYYFPEQEVRALYSQVFRGMEPSEIVRTSSKTGELALGVEVGPVRPGGKRRTAEEYTVRYEPEQNPYEMYNEVEQHLLRRRQVTLCLEDFAPRELGEEEEETLSVLRQLCGELQFEEADVRRLEESHARRRKEDAAAEKVRELASASGLVLMRGTFATAPTQHAWRLEYEHPVSRALPPGGGAPSIVVQCGEAAATQRGRETFSSFATVNATVLGQVISWDNGSRTLSLAPIAIY